MEKFKFDEGLARLEAIVGRLENEEISLEEAMKLYEKGVELAGLCMKKLASAEQKIEILSRAVYCILHT